MSVYDIKQYIIINSAAKWTKGKFASQVAHASMAIFFDRMIDTGNPDGYLQIMTEDMKAWKNGSFAKIILKDEGVCGLYDLEDHAKQFGIPTALIKDSGATQQDEQGITLAIGPFNTKNSEYALFMEHISKLKLY